MFENTNLWSPTCFQFPDCFSGANSWKPYHRWLWYMQESQRPLTIFNSHLDYYNGLLTMASPLSIQ